MDRGPGGQLPDQPGVLLNNLMSCDRCQRYEAMVTRKDTEIKALRNSFCEALLAASSRRDTYHLPPTTCHLAATPMQQQAEQEEEKISNHLMKRLTQFIPTPIRLSSAVQPMRFHAVDVLKQEKVQLAKQLNKEEVTIASLQKNVLQHKAEKVDLETQLETEQEYIVNKLHRQLCDIARQKEYGPCLPLSLIDHATVLCPACLLGYQSNPGSWNARFMMAIPASFSRCNKCMWLALGVDLAHSVQQQTSDKDSKSDILIDHLKKEVARLKSIQFHQGNRSTKVKAQAATLSSQLEALSSENLALKKSLQDEKERVSSLCTQTIDLFNCNEALAERFFNKGRETMSRQRTDNNPRLERSSSVPPIPSWVRHRPSRKNILKASNKSLTSLSLTPGGSVSGDSNIANCSMTASSIPEVPE
eukprot:gene11091-2013_t